ncbi:MAG: hypothetical protein ACE5HE_11865 [Phycisphaerae bacterium]
MALGHSSVSNKCDGGLASVVVAFDIDNTLLDASGTAYGATVSEFLSHIDLGMEADECRHAYEGLRACGDALEVLGLRNPIHERGNADALAVLCMTACRAPKLLGDLGIDAACQPEYRALVRELTALHEPTRCGSFATRLGALVTFCRLRKADSRVRAFCNDVARIRRHPFIAEWAARYRRIEQQQPVTDVAPVVDSIVSRGGIPIVVSQGRHDLQLGKLKRLGLAATFRGRVLTTQAAAEVPGARTLDGAVNRLIASQIEGAGEADDDELLFLWYFRCLIDSWAAKSPYFYGRCLHAVRLLPHSPESALDNMHFAPAELWRQQPLYFVMVGDRYDQDVAPLIDLLGCGEGLKLRLRCGKYGHLHPEEKLPQERRPDMTFATWSALAEFLTEDLSGGMIDPITIAPDVACRADVRLDYLERGLTSPYEAVRSVSGIVSAMFR